MQITKYGNNIKFYDTECYNCHSKFEYTNYDITEDCEQWVRTGLESSERVVNQVITCPVCKAKIVLKQEVGYY